MNDPYKNPVKADSAKEQIAQRLRRARIAAGYRTQTEFSDKNGISQSTYHTHESGTKGLKRDIAQTYARILRIRLAWLLTGEEPMSLGDRPLEPIGYQGVLVRGSVQAGMWKEAAEWPEDEWFREPMPPEDPRYPGISLYGLIVRGDSMNRVFTDGTVLGCIHLITNAIDVKDGDYVIVERVNDKGEVEATVKQLQIDPDQVWWLWPRSTDPAFQVPIRSDDGLKVRIVAKVVRYSSPL